MSSHTGGTAGRASRRRWGSGWRAERSVGGRARVVGAKTRPNTTSASVASTSAGSRTATGPAFPLRPWRRRRRRIRRRLGYRHRSRSRHRAPSLRRSQARSTAGCGPSSPRSVVRCLAGGRPSSGEPLRRPGARPPVDVVRCSRRPAGGRLLLTRKALLCRAFRCAEEDSNLHPVIPDQALNLVTRVSYPSGSRQIVRIVPARGRCGRIGRSGCCHARCHGPTRDLLAPYASAAVPGWTRPDS